MLIVLAVIVSLVALAYPAMRKPLARQQLRAAAKQLRAELARARLEAIESGQAQQFQYVPGTRFYRVEPLNADSSLGVGNARSEFAWEDQATGAGARPFRTSQSEVDQLIETESTNAAEDDDHRTLPKDIAFASREQELDEHGNPDLADDEELDASNLIERSDLSDENELLEYQDWSKPVVFYPNGRTSNAVIQLIGERDYRVRLTLRGVTGAIFVSALERPPKELEEEMLIERPTRVATRPSRRSNPSPLSASQRLFRGSIHGIQTNRAPAP
jgi:Tfp pilus assembly protein FimT